MRAPRSRPTRSAWLLLAVVTIQGGSGATNPTGNNWLEKHRETAIENPSGLLYKRMQDGEGQFHPSFDTYCQIEISISAVKDDGSLQSVETTSLGEPKMTRPVDNMPAVREALELMVEGDYWELYVPSQLGFVGDLKGRKNDIKGDEALFVSLELLSIVSGDTMPKGERHQCYIEITWDQATGKYGYRPAQFCDDKDMGYINTVSAWDSRSVKADKELSRLRSVQKKGNMNQSLAKWVRRRIHILKQFLLEKMRICSIFYVHTPDRGPVAYQEDCNVQEQQYISKVLYEWEVEKVTADLKRLDSLDQGSVDPSLSSWIRRRIRILNQVKSLRSTSFPEKDIKYHEEL